MEHKDCVLDIPYPEIETYGKNTIYANLLLNNYTGRSASLRPSPSISIST